MEEIDPELSSRAIESTDQTQNDLGRRGTSSRTPINNSSPDQTRPSEPPAAPSLKLSDKNLPSTSSRNNERSMKNAECQADYKEFYKVVKVSLFFEVFCGE